MMQILKKIWPDATAVILFILIGIVYFFTPLSQGLVLSGSDHTGALGSVQELRQYHEQTGKETRWTNALFSGMPTYQIAPTYDSRSTLDTLRSIYELGLPTVVMYVFILLLGFYILMRSVGNKPNLSFLGAIAWAFSSYFFIIIGAGHIWKLLTLAFIPPTIAGMVLCYKGRYIMGGALMALFMAFQILSNHLQMTYYFLLVMLLMFIAYLINAIKEHWMGRFVRATATIFVATIIAVCANLPSLYHTYTYSKETMRGRSELAAAGSSQKSGLSPEYITQWSYGVDETLTLLIPNAKGGASVPLSANEIAMSKGQYTQYYNSIGMYWGEQPGTAGPVYVGAFILMLFWLGIFIVRGPMKWALLCATVISVLLSWGHNFMGLTQFFIDHVPLYNKFRTVSSILVIAEFTIPALAIMAMSQIIKQRKDALGKNMWKFYASLALTGGVALIYALLPSLGGKFASSQELEQLAQYPDILNDIINVRKAIFEHDAWRSVLYIMAGAAILFAYAKTHLKTSIALCGIILLCFIDMYGVNKRYLNDGMFVVPEQISNSFVKTTADNNILQDPSPNYRVLNFTTNTFNENETSYFHKSIGGYSAVKLGRYQDLIDYHIAPEMKAFIRTLNQNNGLLDMATSDSILPVINMLNAKYFIIGSQQSGPTAVLNPGALGNAWFIDHATLTTTPNEEIQALSEINLRNSAVVDKSFAKALKAEAYSLKHDSASSIKLTHYEPNKLQYESSSPVGGIVVFSEIYYPGWTATIDNQPLELGRANYMLRAAYIPAGNHTIMMEYEPKSIAITDTIAYMAIALLILSLAGAIIHAFNLNRKKKHNTHE